MTTKIGEHVYANGLRQRWYSDAKVAALVLAKIPAERRGCWTQQEPLRTSPGIWRVDDKTQ